jgi:hypothetical protein
LLYSIINSSRRRCIAVPLSAALLAIILLSSMPTLALNSSNFGLGSREVMVVTEGK